MNKPTPVNPQIMEDYRARTSVDPSFFEAERRTSWVWFLEGRSGIVSMPSSLDRWAVMEAVRDAQHLPAYPVVVEHRFACEMLEFVRKKNGWKSRS